MIIEWEIDKRKEESKQLLSLYTHKYDTNLNRQHLM